MKLSYSWLKDYLKCELSPAQIAEAMTSIGIEVDGVEEQEKIPGGLAGVVVAEVLECEDHPNSDHLHITKVNDGTGEPLTVVCGAPNVAAGQKVLFARVGAVLPGDFKIKKSKIRGVESFGMICAEDELGLGAGHDGIMVLPEDAVVGTPAREYLHLETEAVIEYEITANRVDAASHWGVARDLYAYLKLRGIPCELVRPSVDAFREADADGGLDVEVLDADGAPRYTGITIRGVKTAPSPQWMQDRLTAIGLRPIDNIVDISNYILFELGQPLHTFDADKVKGGKVIVRRATEGEVIRTLDGVERKLSSRDMVIADAGGPLDQERPAQLQRHQQGGDQAVVVDVVGGVQFVLQFLYVHGYLHCVYSNNRQEYTTIFPEKQQKNGGNLYKSRCVGKTPSGGGFRERRGAREAGSPTECWGTMPDRPGALGENPGLWRDAPTGRTNSTYRL